MLWTSIRGSQNQTLCWAIIQSGTSWSGQVPSYLRVKDSHGASPRHVTLIFSYMSLCDAKGGTSPWTASVAAHNLSWKSMLEVDICCQENRKSAASNCTWFLYGAQLLGLESWSGGGRGEPSGIGCPSWLHSVPVLRLVRKKCKVMIWLCTIQKVMKISCRCWITFIVVSVVIWDTFTIKISIGVDWLILLVIQVIPTVIERVPIQWTWAAGTCIHGRRSARTFTAKISIGVDWLILLVIQVIPTVIERVPIQWMWAAGMCIYDARSVRRWWWHWVVVSGWRVWAGIKKFLRLVLWLDMLLKS